MVRVLITYEREPDAERYARHVADYASKVPRATFRHGKVFGAPFGEPSFAYVAEWEFEDMEAARSDPFNDAGDDAQAMGISFQVHFAEISE
jgi:hypothetical protein